MSTVPHTCLSPEWDGNGCPECEAESGLKLAAYRLDWPATAGAGMPRFFGLDDRKRMVNTVAAWRNSPNCPTVVLLYEGPVSIEPHPASAG